MVSVVAFVSSHSTASRSTAAIDNVAQDESDKLDLGDKGKGQRQGIVSGSALNGEHRDQRHEGGTIDIGITSTHSFQIGARRAPSVVIVITSKAIQHTGLIVVSC
jgi:hypothetical protein